MQVATTGAHLIMTEPLFNLPSIRRAALDIAFESFGFESFYSAPAPQFAVHKWAADNPDDPIAQSLSGVVLDAGYSFTHAVPIFDGRVQLAAVQRVRLGGKLLTNLMKEWVRDPPFPRTLPRRAVLALVCVRPLVLCNAQGEPAVHVVLQLRTMFFKKHTQ